MSWGDWGFIDTPEVRWRLAMAWEDWKDKIHRQNADGYPDEDFCGGGDCSSFDWRHDGRDMRYQIDHEDGAWSALDYGHYADSQNKPYVAVHMIRTHPGYRKDGIAEALMRRLVDDHPGVRVDPGDMTQEGQAFHDRMLQKEPRAKALVTAANRIIEAMAWEEWSDRITHDPPDDIGSYGNQGGYTITHGPGQNSVLMYSLNAEGPEDNSVFIDNLFTDPDFQRQGVAEAFFRRLHQDYPDRKINPGAMFPDGQAFHDRMLQKEPRAKALVTAANRIIQSMAWEDWKDKIQGGCKDGCISPLHTHGRYILPEAGAFLNYSHRANNLFISDIYTHPQNRNDGVAEALMRRLTEDHPGVPIDPGYMTPDGQKFHDRMLEKDPSARDLVTAATSILRALEESEI